MIIKKFISLLVIPYLLIVSVVLAYILHEKYKIRKLRNISLSPVYPIDLNKKRKNLQIQSMTYNFILALLLMELISTSLWGVYKFNEAAFHSSLLESINITDTCVMRFEPYSIFLIYESFYIPLFILNVSTIVFGLIGTVMCLFLIVLRRAYLNLPYNNWIFGYSIYLLSRFLASLVFSSFIRTYYIAGFAYFPLGLVDICIYFRVCRSFYLLLKGRRDEARWHSTRKDFVDKNNIVNRFFYSQVVTISMLILLLTYGLVDFISKLVYVSSVNSCVWSYMYFGLFPNLNLSSIIPLSTVSRLGSYASIIEVIFVGLLQLILVLSYLLVCMDIFIKIVRWRRRFRNVNQLTRPLIVAYKNRF